MHLCLFYLLTGHLSYWVALASLVMRACVLYPWDICSFLQGNGGVVDLRERAGWGFGKSGRGETVVGINTMREDKKSVHV